MSENKDVPKIRFPGFIDAWEQQKLKDIAEFNPKSALKCFRKMARIFQKFVSPDSQEQKQTLLQQMFV